MAGKNGSTWKHSWVPTNAAAALLKTHGRSSSFHAFAPGATARGAVKATPKRKQATKSTQQRVSDVIATPPLRGGARSVPLASIGRLRSGNEPGLTVAQEFQKKVIRGQYSANDIARAAQYGQTPQQYQADITAHIKEHGVINAAQASEGTLDEGFHRYVAMRQLRKRSLPLKHGYG